MQIFELDVVCYAKRLYNNLAKSLCVTPKTVSCLNRKLILKHLKNLEHILYYSLHNFIT